MVDKEFPRLLDYDLLKTTKFEPIRRRPLLGGLTEQQAAHQAQEAQKQAESVIRRYATPQWQPHYPGTYIPLGRGIPMPGGGYFGRGVPMPGGGMFGAGVPMPGGGMFRPR